MPPLIEFVVKGTPVSARGKSERKKKWKRKVREQAAAAWGPIAMTKQLKSTFIHFHKGATPPLDNDNISRPTHDAMTKIIYADDVQVIHTETIQKSLDSPLNIQGVTQLLLDAYNEGEDFLYVRLDDLPVQIILSE
jgi:hypothetical protein